LGLVGGWSGKAAGLLLSETWQHTHTQRLKKRNHPLTQKPKMPFESICRLNRADSEKGLVSGRSGQQEIRCGMILKMMPLD
jgi:hypothetical protein